MNLPLNQLAFGTWVPAFVTWNNSLSSIFRPPTAREIAAHRGLFAKQTLSEGNVYAFLRNICPAEDVVQKRDASRDSQKFTDLHWILASSSFDGVAHKLEEMQLFPAGNGRCGRALEMWGRIKCRASGVSEGKPAAYEIRYYA